MMRSLRALIYPRREKRSKCLIHCSDIQSLLKLVSNVVIATLGSKSLINQGARILTPVSIKNGGIVPSILLIYFKADNNSRLFGYLLYTVCVRFTVIIQSLRAIPIRYPILSIFQISWGYMLYSFTISRNRTKYSAMRSKLCVFLRIAANGLRLILKRSGCRSSHRLAYYDSTEGEGFAGSQS